MYQYYFDILRHTILLFVLQMNVFIFLIIGDHIDLDMLEIFYRS
jgi:hypothetical protein